MNRINRNYPQMISIGMILILFLSGFSSTLIKNEFFDANKYDFTSLQQVNSNTYSETLSASLINSKNILHTSKEISSLPRNISSDIIIKSISASFNKIILTIKNIGNQNITNISIDVNYSGGIFVKTSGNIEIHKLQAEMTENQDSAIAAFERLGFREEARLKKHVTDIRGRRRDLVVMTLDIEDFSYLMEDFVESHDFRIH